MTSNKQDKDYDEIVDESKDNDNNRTDLEKRKDNSENPKNYKGIINELKKNNENFKHEEKYTNESIETIKEEIRKEKFDTIELERMLFYIENNFLDNKKLFELIFDSSALLASIAALAISLEKGREIIYTIIVTIGILALLLILCNHLRSKNSNKVQVIQRALIELIEENKNTK